MNIQPLAHATATRTEERAAPAETAAASAPASTSTAAAARPAAAKAEPDRKELDAAVKHINDALQASSQGLEFSVDADSKATVVKIVDRNTHEVLRQMPSREALEIAKSIDKAMGKLINQSA